jgi:hypothetical protein
MLVKPAYFVSEHGNDKNDGSISKPIATLQRAAILMARSVIKTTYVEGGSYTLSSAVELGPDDNGERILAYPGEEVILSGGTARLASIVVLRGARHLTITGLTFSQAGRRGALMLSNASDNEITGNHFVSNVDSVVLSSGSSDNLVAGNEIDNSGQTAVEVKDGSNGNTFDSNVIDGTGAVGTAGGGFFLHGVENNKLSHNLVKNTAGLGIGISNWNSATINVGNVIEYNIVENANTAPGSIDSGAIYILGRSQIDTKTIIHDNMVIGTGAPHPAHTVGIYLDDLSSGVVVQNNIVSGVGSDAMQVHGGRDNVINNNIMDTGSGLASAVLFQAAPPDTHPKIAMRNNVVSKNIIYSSSRTPKVFVYYAGGSLVISNNLYFNATGATMTTTAPVEDRMPRFGNPEFRDPGAYDYTIGAISIAAGIGFEPIDQRRIGVMPTTAHWY